MCITNPTEISAYMKSWHTDYCMCLCVDLTVVGIAFLYIVVDLTIKFSKLWRNIYGRKVYQLMKAKICPNAQESSIFCNKKLYSHNSP